MKASDSADLNLEVPLAGTGLLPLRGAEPIVLHAVELNEEADCSSSTLEIHDTSVAQGWEDSQALRGEFLQWLCLYLIANKKSSKPNVLIKNAHLVTRVDLSGLTVPIALTVRSCRFEQPIDLSESHLLKLDLDGSWAPELYAANLVVDKNLSLSSFCSPGRVSLEGAAIGGSVDCTGATLGERGRPCARVGYASCLRILDAEDINVGGSLFLGADEKVGRFQAHGEVNLVGARIGGDLDCIVGLFDGQGGPSVMLEKSLIQGGLFISNGFESVGFFRVHNSEIKNGVRADGGQFKLPENSVPSWDRPALSIENSKVYGSSAFKVGFLAEGVSLRFSEFGEVDFVGASVGRLGLDVRNAKVQQFEDDRPHWPAKGHLHIDGFWYGRIFDSENKAYEETKVNQRLDWIDLDPEPSPQPYRQLAQVLLNEGDDDGAKLVLERMQAILDRQSGPIGELEGSVSSIIGYGYAPGNAIWLLLGVTAVSWIVYRRNFLAGRITPSDKDAYEQFKRERQLPDYYPRFSSFIYALENSFPLVNLGQSSKWQPDPTPLSACVSSSELASTEHRTAGVRHFNAFVMARVFYCSTLIRENWLRLFLWFQLLLGWFLATLFLAGITGLIRK